MKRLMMTVAALALLMPAARADDMKAQAEWVSTLFVYQAQCRSLGISQNEFIEIMSPIPNAIFKVASDNVHAAFDRDNAKWCENTQALIAANRKWRFQR